MSGVARMPVRIQAPIEDGYLDLRKLAAYSSLSLKTLRRALVDPVHPLPHYRAGGKILVRRYEFDAWLERTKVTDGGKGGADLHRLVDDVVAGLGA